jgi:hypothetical protein
MDAMPMLECPGVFTMPFVPDGWTATSDGDSFYELQPPSRQAAVHISVYHRAPSALEPGQAQGFLRKFVDQRPPEGDVQLTSMPPQEDEQRAFAKYRNRNDDGNLTEWFAACILWRSAMLMCSCNGMPGDAALKEGEVMIASIFQGTEPA